MSSFHISEVKKGTVRALENAKNVWDGTDSSGLKDCPGNLTDMCGYPKDIPKSEVDIFSKTLKYRLSSFESYLTYLFQRFRSDLTTIRKH